MHRQMTEHPTTGDIVKLWAWTTAGIGFVVLVVTYVQGARLGVWADEHPTVAATLPGSGLEFVVAALGLVLLVGGALVGLRASRRGRLR